MISYDTEKDEQHYYTVINNIPKFCCLLSLFFFSLTESLLIGITCFATPKTLICQSVLPYYIITGHILD